MWVVDLSGLPEGSLTVGQVDGTGCRETSVSVLTSTVAEPLAISPMLADLVGGRTVSRTRARGDPLNTLFGIRSFRRQPYAVNR